MPQNTERDQSRINNPVYLRILLCYDQIPYMGADIVEHSRGPQPLQMINIHQPIKLHPTVQHYEWGQRGTAALVAQLSHSTDENRPYAELWVGAHPKSPATITANGKTVTLRDLIASAPREILGARVSSAFGNELPFLFKVLSIGGPLSIQAHPDKSLAALLHARDPKNYPDSNHKPELAIAVTKLEALMGFKSLAEIKEHLKKTPELALLVEPTISARLANHTTGEDPTLLKEVYSSILKSNQAALSNVTKKLYTRLEKSKELSREDQWVQRLAKDYPDGDVGLLSFYLLNLVDIPRGSAVFIGANLPHAYLSGDIVECMANSDNVVRAGLTPKFKDVATLVEMLNYSSDQQEFLKPIGGMGEPKQYKTPTNEFALELFDSAITDRKFNSSGGIELLFCLTGEATITTSAGITKLLSGDSCLVPAALPSYTLSFTGGDLYRVRVP